MVTGNNWNGSTDLFIKIAPINVKTWMNAIRKNQYDQKFLREFCPNSGYYEAIKCKKIGNGS